MFVGAARVVLQIPGARSLKDRRMVVKSFKDRVKARWSISVAELDDGSKLQVARLGVSVVSSDSAVCRELLDNVRNMASNLPDALLAGFRSRVYSFGKAGAGLDEGSEEVL